MFVVATFMGADGSMGYRTAKDYKLKITFGGRAVRIAEIIPETGKTRHGSVVPYSSMETFMDNWCAVSKVTE